MKVKIILEDGETREEAQELLIKALESQGNGELHTDAFMDPVMEEACTELKRINADINHDMLMEIMELLEKEQA